MDYKSYISGRSFSFIQPSDSGVGLFTNAGIPSTVDIRNTNLPYNDKETKETLYEICGIPRMSTFAIGAIINLIVSNMTPDTAFVNIGVWHGYTFLCGLVDNPDKKCIGVDNFSEFNGPREEFLERFEDYKGKNHLFMIWTIWNNSQKYTKIQSDSTFMTATTQKKINLRACRLQSHSFQRIALSLSMISTGMILWMVQMNLSSME